MGSEKRILWLLNHTTLRDFEVPMLIDMGYEVFTPKIYQYEFGDLSASVTWDYDYSLSIPEDALNILNACDMYQETLPEQVIRIMNKYFEIAIFGAFTSQIKMLVKTFKGLMIFQAFGLESTMSYSKLFGYDSFSFMNQICSLGDRFWFAATYENLPEVECDYFKKQYVYLPIGLKKDTVNRIWSGGDKRILFIGPRIMTSSYYHKVYQNFKKNFGMIPHVIGGAQMISVPNDPTVLGFLPKEQFDYNMRHLAAMYYHSQEPRHLHYHPLEAVVNGMPLVFMAGGMLDFIGGKNLPGRCENITKARRMLKRLSEGDMTLAEKIVDQQGCLLDTFRKDFCRQKWEEAFQMFRNSMCVNANIKEQKEEFSAKIAIIIPQPYTGGVLDFSVRLALAIQQGANDKGDHVEIVVYHMEHECYREQDYFRQLHQAGIRVASYHWSYKQKEWFQNFASLKKIDRDVFPQQANVLEDGVSNLKDFDYCIYTSDRIPTPCFSLKKHAVVVHDVIQRYIPEMFDLEYEIKRQNNTRQADHVLVTTPYMRDAAINYIGLPESKVVEIPPLYEYVAPIAAVNNENSGHAYFLWATNCSIHKNHKRALKALSEYYAKGGTLKCYITGAMTHLLSPHYTNFQEASSEYTESIRNIIKNNRDLKRNIVIKGEMEKTSYLKCLAGAKFIFHPGYADNGNGACVEALQLGVPVISASYPAMDYMNERLHAGMMMFDPMDSSDIAQKLLLMESEMQQRAKKLPTNQELMQFMVEGQYPLIYDKIRTMIRGY